MKNFFFLLFMFLIVLFARAAEVTMIVTSIPANTPPEDNIFIAGSFNGWDPGNATFILQSNTNGQPQIVINGTGTIQFKFTRGSWATVEGNETGGYLPNRTFTFGTQDTLLLTILSWEDLGGPGTTAAENVVIMDNAFFMPQLNRTRRIWLYLPPDYETSGKDYPVLYMHDGQNLFDLYTSFAGEWEVDETLNSLFSNGKEVPIVVGIDNGGTYRIAEYTPWPNQQYGGGDGDLYAKFIVETLKPYIDEHYRTKPQREHTGVMGSSLGGLISHYIGLKYQEILSKAGVFSPSFWFSDSSYIFAYQTGKVYPMRYYMMGGTNESGGLVQQMNLMMDTLQAAGFDDSELYLKVVPGGQHNELLWRTQFGQAYQWLYLDGSTEIDEFMPGIPIRARIICDKLYLEAKDSALVDQLFDVTVYSITGQTVFQSRITPGSSKTISGNLKGLYIVTVNGGKVSFNQKIMIL
ncbi:MAG: T9SS type A sorting domain-containing protein [Bacteroidales bacterium]|nr:T9SS type A sorting domain-containing protein [Bacteroidales bacterium]